MLELMGVLADGGDCGVAVTTTLLGLALTGVWDDGENSGLTTASGGAIDAVDGFAGDA